MSDLLAMYIDTELKASKRSNECHESISGRIASYLYVYLGMMNRKKEIYNYISG